jgi:rod shape-determining protein MreD
MMPTVGDQLLLPVRPWFIWLTLMFALMLSLAPIGRAPAMPDLMALTLVCWTVHQPRRVGLGIGFCLGIVIDVHQGALLGQHALAYTLITFLGIMVHRRLPWFSASAQAAQVLPLFAAAHGCELLVRMAAGGSFPGWSLLAAPLVEATLWPFTSWLLLAPQRRAPDPDENRPL